MTKTLDVYVRVHSTPNIVSGPLDFHGANVFFYSSEGHGVSRSRMDQEILKVVSSCKNKGQFCIRARISIHARKGAKYRL